jgi:hypothetical protein
MLFTSLIPDRSAGQGFTYKFKAHQEDDPLNPRDSMPPPSTVSPWSCNLEMSVGSEAAMWNGKLISALIKREQ